MKKEIFEIGKRKFIKKGFLALLAGVGAAIISKIPFVRAVDYVKADNIELTNPLPVAQGGTGSATVGGARDNLDVKTIPNFGSGGAFLDGNLISERYTAEAGEVGLIDVGNSTAIYSTGEDSYGQGVVQTDILYNSTTEITSLLVEEVTKSTVTQGTVDVSFDAGLSWAAGKAIGSSITDFSGTSADGSDYKLKLKFTLGATYDSATAYMWVTTGSLNVVKRNAASCGTTSDALSFGGLSSAYLNTTEKWSGSSWVTTTALTQAKTYPAGCGTTAAALCMGGNTDSEVAQNVTEKWAGSSWVTTGVLTTTLHSMVGCGTTVAALAIGGLTGDSGADKQSKTEIWNGTSWATTTALTKAWYSKGGCGTTSAALVFGGISTGYSDSTEKWAGSSWVTTTVLSATTAYPSGCGTASAALCVGGNVGGAGIVKTEKWDGSVWITTSSLVQGRYVLSDGACGITSAALCFGGNDGEGTNYDTTERWMAAGLQKGFAAKIN